MVLLDRPGFLVRKPLVTLFGAEMLKTMVGNIY
jgi:hypothetical protein